MPNKKTLKKVLNNFIYILMLNIGHKFTNSVTITDGEKYTVAQQFLSWKGKDGPTCE